MAAVICVCGPGMTGDAMRECIPIISTPSGCLAEQNCPDHQTCIDGRCTDPCRSTKCAPGALCRAVGHRAVCSCPNGQLGNAQTQCLITVGCKQKSDCPLKEACVNGRCLNPCSIPNVCGINAICESTSNGFICKCDEKMQGDPYVECRASGCIDNSQCLDHQQCVNQICQEVCKSYSCVENSKCIAKNHEKQCQCNSGYVGDPDRFCSLPVTPLCIKDSDCLPLQACINEKCQDPCKALNPCGVDARCQALENEPMIAMSCSCPDGYEGDPDVRCSPIQIENECSSDVDCPLTLSCISGECQNPCPNGCAETASCSVINHRAVCHCIPGYAGDPTENCYAINTECVDDDDCSESEICSDNECKDPCGQTNPCHLQECKAINHKPVCSCPENHKFIESQGCQPTECSKNEHCASFETCIDGSDCQDPCNYYNPCGEGASCKVSNHTHQCNCLQGFEGNPVYGCQLPKDPSGCIRDKDCPPTHGCIYDSSVTRYHNKVSAVYIRFDNVDSGATCRDLCEEHKPCGPNAICSVIDTKPRRSMSCSCPPGYHGDAKIECRPIPSEGGCLKHSDCLFSESCLNGLCRDPCNCGINAKCHIFNHHPYCSCPPAHTGDPNTACHRVDCADNLDCPSSRTCQNNKCVDMCEIENPCSTNSICSVENHKPVCSCPSGTIGNPIVSCTPIGCRNADDCPSDQACTNGQCSDPCSENPCGARAMCIVENHKHVCTCSEGHSGNPNQGCRPIISMCISDLNCAVGLVCVQGECQNPCDGNSQCAVNALCKVEETQPVKSITCTCPTGFTGDAEIQCRKTIPPPPGKCTKNSDCPDKLACLNDKCLDPCNCGENAICRITDHRPVCSCAPQYQGDPYTACVASGCSRDSDCGLTDKCHNGVCLDPCIIDNPCHISSECFSVNREAKCRCPVGLKGDPYVQCEIVGCQSDNDCTPDRSCRNGQCLDSCLYSTCGIGANCLALNHNSVCQCPPGYTGNPTSRCEKVPSSPCNQDSQCPIGMVCSDNGLCKDPCASEPCGDKAKCEVIESIPFKSLVCKCESGFHGDAYTACKSIPVDQPICVRNSDCSNTEACIDQKCRDPCDCGDNAQCTILNHRPICTCIQGYEGNPQTACFATGCKTNGECPSDLACYNGNCVDPCLVDNPCAPRAECQAVSHEAVCFCPSGTSGNPKISCITIGCRVDTECPADRMCLNGRCQDQCLHNNTCAPNANCRGISHSIECVCPPGTSGNPIYSCSDKIQNECRSDFDCGLELACMDGTCKRPCEIIKPCEESKLCTLEETRPVKSMTCACPKHMVVAEDGKCVDFETPFGLGCRADSECPTNKACLNTQCIEPCNCGPNAECTVIGHRPLCECLPGYQGDPNTGCYKVGCSVNEECPTDKMCYNQVCVNPCAIEDPCAVSAECYPEMHKAKCRCPEGLEGDPFIRCQVIGCRSNSECPTDKACINKQCVNPCLYENHCAPTADCYVFQHTAGCRCPADKPYGDPMFECKTGMDPEAKDPERQCYVDSDCASKHACLEGYCRNPCHVLDPCDDTAMCEVIDSLPVRTMICICPDGYIMTEQGTCELVEIPIPPGCRADNDCPSDEACINRMCREACDCGPNAACEIVSHRPVCTCQVGFQGNPDVGCFPVGCQVDSECADDQACYDGVCANPCLVNDPCATNAECYAQTHRPYCRCPSGLEGDAYTECITVGCRTNSECATDRGCINRQCVDLCIYEDPCAPSAECLNINHEAKCRCPPGTTGDPRRECYPIPQPICIVDSDCPLQHACINEQCVNPCKVLDPCHESAVCHVIDTEPLRTMICVCPDGMFVEEGGVCALSDPIKPLCETNSECPSEKACFNGFCKDPCQCGANTNCEIVDHHPICSCKRGYEGEPEIGCYELGCFGQDDCPTTHACRNGQCQPVCGINNEPCGADAECQGVNHQAVCYCPPGLQGAPHEACIAIGCAADVTCPDERSCINQQCLDPCAFDPCQGPAECRVANHQTECPCPPGYNGTLLNGCDRIQLGCRTDGDCPSKLSCINQQCVPPCSFDPCGENTECRVVDTLPVRTTVCECLHGYQGDAMEKCTPVVVCPLDKGYILDEEGVCRCPTEKGFFVDKEGNCVKCPIELGYILSGGMCVCDPGKGYIKDPISEECICPPPAYKDDNGDCTVPKAPIIPIGCESNRNCPDDKKCDRGVCVPPCGFDPCDKNAVCINKNHTAVCGCIKGYDGDAYDKSGGCKPKVYRTDFPRPDMVVNCLADGVQVDIAIGNPGFDGVMYVKGYSKNEECRKVVKYNVDTGTIDFKVKFGSCGLIHEDGLANFILVIQKHPKLVTYKAQAYHIKCTYNTGEKTITIGFNVSMLTTAGTIANTGPPPTCSMKITNVNGGSIDRAEIGDLLMLRVQVEPSNIYGGFARNCIALTSDNEGENEYIVTDENGCATDAGIFGEWEVDDAEDKALMALFNAFKFPSSNNIRFQCNVRVCFGKCQPVNCNGYDAFGKRRRRQITEEDAEVIYGEEATLDGQLREIQVSSQAILTIERKLERYTAPDPSVAPQEEVCVNKWGFIIALIITALLALVAVAVAVSCWLMAYRRRPKHGGPLPHPPEFPNPLFTTPEPLAEPTPDYLS